jgi:uncharacterized glyoxalase superfamily protein PhnB
VILAGECPDALAPADTGDHAWFAYIEVGGIDTIKPLRDEPWGMREFGVRTIDGHRMMFGEAVG